MLELDEDALVCDLAETYGIYNYRSLPATLVATFSIGLRENSRIKLKIADSKVDSEHMFLAAIVDRLSMLIWMQSEDGRNNTNRPKSILADLLGTTNETKYDTFQTGEDFHKAWNDNIKRAQICQN
jgi:hypothetical protein